MRRKLVGGLIVLVLVFVAYLLLAPVPVRPVAWQSPADAGYVGPYARNTRLAGVRDVELAGATGPEHVAVGPDRKLYAAVDGGAILRMNDDGSAVETWARTGGRVLGFDFDGHGRVIAADAMRGLLAIDGGTNGSRIAVLADKVRVGGADDPIRYANGVVVARDGKIYFTDSSRRFSPADCGGTFDASILDIFEHSATGRVLVFDPATSRTEIVATGFSFANGIALSADERSLFVAETGEYRVWRLAVATRALDVRSLVASGRTPRAEADVVLANLPGYPDNLMRGMSGRFWVGLVSARSGMIDAMAASPFMRTVAFRLKPLWPLPHPYGHVFAFDESGAVVADLQDPAGKYPDTTGVTETGERLYIQSIHARALGWLPKEGALDARSR